MNENEAKTFIVENVKVTTQKVGIAKRYVLDHFNEDTGGLLEAFGRHMDATIPDKVVLHPTVDAIPDLKRAAEGITWRLGFGGHCFPPLPR